MNLIRPMTLADAERVAEIHVKAWQVAYRGILSDEILDAIKLEERVALWRDTLIPQNGRKNLVLEEHGLAWGWSAFGACRDKDKDPARTGELFGIYVSPEKFRHGYGRALWEQTFRLMTEEPITEITLWVLQENTRARGFYESMGFAAEAGVEKRTERLGNAAEVRYCLPL